MYLFYNCIYTDYDMFTYLTTLYGKIKCTTHGWAVIVG